MKSIQEATVEELAERFLNISRQRISTLFNKYAYRGDKEILTKIKNAKVLAKKLRKERKEQMLDFPQSISQNTTIETEKENSI